MPCRKAIELRGTSSKEAHSHDNPWDVGRGFEWVLGFIAEKGPAIGDEKPKGISQNHEVVHNVGRQCRATITACDRRSILVSCVCFL